MKALSVLRILPNVSAQRYVVANVEITKLTQHFTLDSQSLHHATAMFHAVT